MSQLLQNALDEYLDDAQFYLDPKLITNETLTPYEERLLNRLELLFDLTPPLRREETVYLKMENDQTLNNQTFLLVSKKRPNVNPKNFYLVELKLVPGSKVISLSKNQRLLDRKGKLTPLKSSIDEKGVEVLEMSYLSDRQPKEIQNLEQFFNLYLSDSDLLNLNLDKEIRLIFGPRFERETIRNELNRRLKARSELEYPTLTPGYLNIMTYNLSWEALDASKSENLDMTSCLLDGENLCQRNILQILTTAPKYLNEQLFDFIALQEVNERQWEMIRPPIEDAFPGIYETLFSFHGLAGVALLYNKNFTLEQIVRGHFPQVETSRPYLIAVFRQGLIFINVHFPHLFELEGNQSRPLLEYLNSELRKLPQFSDPRYAIVLAGDFNDPKERYLRTIPILLEGSGKIFYLPKTSPLTCCYPNFDSTFDNILTTIDRPEIYTTLSDEDRERYIGLQDYSIYAYEINSKLKLLNLNDLDAINLLMKKGYPFFSTAPYLELETMKNTVLSKMKEVFLNNEELKNLDEEIERMKKEFSVYRWRFHSSFELPWPEEVAQIIDDLYLNYRDNWIYLCQIYELPFDSKALIKLTLEKFPNSNPEDPEFERFLSSLYWSILEPSIKKKREIVQQDEKRFYSSLNSFFGKKRDWENESSLTFSWSRYFKIELISPRGLWIAGAWPQLTGNGDYRISFPELDSGLAQIITESRWFKENHLNGWVSENPYQVMVFEPESLGEIYKIHQE